MRITRVALRDFQSYRSLDLDLSHTRSVVVVGRNGHGKSALLDAITWALYDRHRYGTRSDKLVRDGGRTARVVLEFVDGRSRVIRVQREKPLGGTGTLSLSIDGSEYSGHTIADTEARLAQLIGLSFDALVAGPFMVQAGQYKAASSLAQAGPSQRADLLIEVFDLAIYPVLFELAKERGVAANARLSTIREEGDRLAATVEGKAEVEARLVELRTVADKLGVGLAEAEEAVRQSRSAVERHADVAARRNAAAARTASVSERLQEAQAQVAPLEQKIEAERLKADEVEPALTAIENATDDELTAAAAASTAATAAKVTVAELGPKISEAERLLADEAAWWRRKAPYRAAARASTPRARSSLHRQDTSDCMSWRRRPPPSSTSTSPPPCRT